jgi:predicted alpha/beta-fold hydrolase
MPSSFFRCCHVLTQRSGHLQTIYSAIGNFLGVDPVAYDRQVVFLYYTNRRLIPTFAGGFSKPKMVEPCQVVCCNLEKLRSLLSQGSRLHAACFRPCPPGRNTDHCSFTRPDWWSVHKSDCCLIVGPDAVVGSHESYVRSILAPAVMPAHRGGLGYRAVVVNSRGCTPSI